MAEACAPATRPLLPVSGPCGDGRGGRLATSGGACPCVPTSHCWRWPGLDSELGDQGRDVEPFGCLELARGAEMQRCQRRALDTAQCPLDAAHWTLHVRPRRGAPCSPPPALACQPGQRGCRRPPRAFAPGEASVCRAQQGRVSDPPSHGRFVPSPRHCHSEFCGPPRGRGGAPLGTPCRCPPPGSSVAVIPRGDRVVRPRGPLPALSVCRLSCWRTEGSVTCGLGDWRGCPASFGH